METAVRDAVDNALSEILGLVKISGNNGYLKRTDLEHMLQEIRNNLRSDPALYDRLVLKPLNSFLSKGP